MRARLITLLVRYWKFVPAILVVAALMLKLVFAKADLDPIPIEDGPALW